MEMIKNFRTNLQNLRYDVVDFYGDKFNLDVVINENERLKKLKNSDEYKEALEIHKENFKNANELIIDVIINSVCRFFSISTEDLTKKTNKRPIVHARQVVYYLADKYTYLTLQDIGKLMGGFDHATVMHGRDSLINEISTMFKNKYTNQTVKAEMQVIEQDIKVKISSFNIYSYSKHALEEV